MVVSHIRPEGDHIRAVFEALRLTKADPQGLALGIHLRSPARGRRRHKHTLLDLSCFEVLVEREDHLAGPNAARFGPRAGPQQHRTLEVFSPSDGRSLCAAAH